MDEGPVTTQTGDRATGPLAHVIEVEGPNFVAWEQFRAVMESLAHSMDDGPMVTNDAGVEFLNALAERGYHVVPYERCQCDIVGDGMPGCPVHR